MYKRTYFKNETRRAVDAWSKTFWPNKPEKKAGKKKTTSNIVEVRVRSSKESGATTILRYSDGEIVRLGQFALHNLVRNGR